NTGNELARGMLIHGPPGVGKSLVAMGVVHRLGFTCVPLDASRVLSKVVGASEAAIARAFAAARAAAPCVLLLDQVETLAGHRGAASMGQEGTGDRIVTCLLTELDGILAKGNAGGGVFVIAMSSNIAQIDSALLRPGRLDVHIHLAQPNTLEQAKQLVDGFASRHPHALSQHELDKHVAKRCVGMTGAQVKGVWERAAVRAIR
ncbi:P-loop containing nucleoside triphosphate hydrolase protein, partial [Catenaria anguillulae PL171]